MNVGVIGLGTMGAPMARNLARAGFELAVTSRTFARAQALAGELTARALEVGDLAAASDIIVTCLPDAPEVRSVCLDAGGILERARPGTVVVDCSTIAPEEARTLAGHLAGRGIALLDAPVSGGQKGAIEGTLTFFVGGDEAALGKAMPVLTAMGKRITHLGPAGAGQLGKAANQILVANNLMGVAEALAFAARAGLPLEPLHQALTAGAANSWALEVLGRKMMARDFAPAFAVRHQQKDLAIVLRTARQGGVPLPGVALAHELLGSLEAQGRGDDGTQALLTVYERLMAS